MADDPNETTGPLDADVSRVAKEKEDFKLTHIIDFEELLKSNDIKKVAALLSEGALEIGDFMKKDIIDRFLDFVFFKVQTGNVDIPSMVFPTKRMLDGVLEKKIIELINVHLYPEIIFRLLKFFTRNVHDSDTNLYIANMIYSEEIIKAIYDTYKLFRKDIFKHDQEVRTLNVKRIQQLSPRSDDRQSSPLDAAARLKYILEFFLMKHKIGHLYTKEDIMFSRIQGEEAD